MAMIELPDFIKSTVSALKVENVLKPPQMPTKTNIFIFGFDINLSLKKAIVAASMIQLNTFEHKVAIGKTDLKFD